MFVSKKDNPSPIDFKFAFPNSTFGPSGPSDDFLESNGYAKVSLWKNYDPNTEKLVNVEPYYEAPFVYTVEVQLKTEQEIAKDAEAKKLETENRYISELESFFDNKAKERRYDNRITCALRAGYVGPFQAEAIAFATWMDQCNAYAYRLLNDWIAGRVELPSIEDFIGAMPTLTWPD